MPTKPDDAPNQNGVWRRTIKVEDKWVYNQRVYRGEIITSQTKKFLLTLECGHTKFVPFTVHAIKRSRCRLCLPKSKTTSP